MSKYINVELAKAQFTGNFRDDYPTALIKALLDDVPAADVRENKRGEWKYISLDKFKKYKVVCPVCGEEYVDNYDGYINVDDFNFCPNCGADMREEAEQ